MNVDIYSVVKTYLSSDRSELPPLDVLSVILVTCPRHL